MSGTLLRGDNIATITTSRTTYKFIYIKGDVHIMDVSPIHKPMYEKRLQVAIKRKSLLILRAKRKNGCHNAGGKGG